VTDRKAARVQIEEMLTGLPLGTVLSVNKIVIKAQAHIRGIISRKQFRHAMTRLSGHLGISESRGSLRPDLDEIAAFVESTQITKDSCKGKNMQALDASASHLQGVEKKEAQDTAKTFPKINAGSGGGGGGGGGGTSVPPNSEQEEAEEESDAQAEEAQRHTSAGYFRFKTAGIEYGVGCLARYLCLDLSQADEQKASAQSLKNSCIATAFVHLRVAGKAQLLKRQLYSHAI
jgi:hypothetical protein